MTEGEDDDSWKDSTIHMISSLLETNKSFTDADLFPSEHAFQVPSLQIVRERLSGVVEGILTRLWWLSLNLCSAFNEPRSRQRRPALGPL